MKRKQFVVSLVVGLLGVGALLLVLAEFHEEIAEPHLMYLDQLIQTMVHGFTSPDLTRIMFALAWIGSPNLLFPATLVIAAWLWWRRLRQNAVIVLTAMAGAAFLIWVLKLYFHRLRPDVSWAFADEHSFSFPSGHSITAVVFYGILVYLAFHHLRSARNRVAVVVLAAALILGIGLCRIYLGVHYPSDVAAGYLVGFSWLTTVMLADWNVRRMGRTNVLV